MLVDLFPRMDELGNSPLVLLPHYGASSKYLGADFTLKATDPELRYSIILQDLRVLPGICEVTEEGASGLLWDAYDASGFNKLWLCTSLLLS